jgi:hypothetical protein
MSIFVERPVYGIANIPGSASGFFVLFFRVPALLGPGAFARLGEAKVSLAKVDIVPLTHLHIVSAG